VIQMMKKPVALGKVYPELQKMLDEKNAEIARIKTELMATRIDNDQLKIIINNAIRFIDGNRAYGTLNEMKKILEGGENEDGFTPNAYDDDGNPVQLGITNTLAEKPALNAPTIKKEEKSDDVFKQNTCKTCQFDCNVPQYVVGCKEGQLVDQKGEPHDFARNNYCPMSWMVRIIELEKELAICKGNEDVR